MTDYLTTTEYAHRLGINPSRVRQLLAEGRIPGARKHGRDWLIPADARPTEAEMGPRPAWAPESES